LLEAFAASAIGGILCLDRIFTQAMVSRPMVAGTIIGMVLKEPYTGLMTGALVELFWIDQSQIGTYIPPNDSIAAIILTTSTILSGQTLGCFSRELIALSFLLCIPFGILGREMDVIVMRANDGLSRKALEDAINGDDGGIEKKQIFGVVRYLLMAVVFILVFSLIMSHVILWVFPAITDQALSSLKYVYSFLPLLGIAVALNTINLRGMMPVFCGIFLILAVFSELF
jgi:mannose/fructose/N-acetylgalactosamine-specific phosphotransferase system component IIC